jgi:hypothetical protein
MFLGSSASALSASKRSANNMGARFVSRGRILILIIKMTMKR